ncbi:MAG: methionine--tRNA ligase [Halanaerobiales bacterium]
MTIFIGGAWPYANGSLHLGHVASLLPGDILARYYRQKGEEVLYVSGSDCHGTPISLRAQQEDRTAAEIADKYHREFVESFKKLGFSYDKYIKTDNPNHHQVVQKVFLELLEKGYIYKKEIEQLYCPECKQFLPDRYVEGICPQCGEDARGDQCDNCSELLDPVDLLDKSCKLCGASPVQKNSEHFYLALSKFSKELTEYLEKNRENWRDNAVKLSQRYLDEGLKDRAVSRDLPWGIDLPLEGYENKKIYVWMEAVLGYYTASKVWEKETKADIKKGCKIESETESNIDINKFWKKDVKSYYVHGKDNIPFHTLILPALLLGIGNLKLPEYIVSSEYLTIEGKQLSTSRNWAIWADDVLDRYDPDSIRYYLTINGPEKRDSNFSWQEFIHSHNGELLGAYGNLVNRTLVFIEKYFSGEIPDGRINPEVQASLKDLYNEIGDKIENAEFKSALEGIFEFIRGANKYFDSEEPWLTRRNDIEKCRNTIYTCVQIIANIANLLKPFLPYSSIKVKKYLNLKESNQGQWSYIKVERGKMITEVDILFERIDPTTIEVERNLLKDNKVLN